MRWNCVLVRFSELALKSESVRRRYMRRLIYNIRIGLKRERIDGEVCKSRGRIIIKTNRIEEACFLLKRIFGVVSVSPCIHMNLRELSDFIKKNAEELVTGNSFAVRVRRVGSHSFTSQKLAEDLGSIIVEKTRKKVDLSHPESEVFVEVRQENVYVFTEKILGPGGMPLGSQGRVLCFIDGKGGIVATWLMMKRGCHPIIYHTVPVDVLDKWSHGIELEKIKVKKFKDIEEIIKEKESIPLVLPSNLEKNSIEELEGENKTFETMIFRPIIGFIEEEIEKLYQKIKI